MAIPYFGDAVICLPFKGANNSTVFTDYSHTNKVVNAVSSAKITTSTFKFYDSCLDVSAAGSYLSIPNHSDFYVTNGDFSIEVWHKLSSTTAGVYRDLIRKRASSTSNNFFILYQYNNAIIAELSTSGTSTTHSVNATKTADTNWYHIVLERYGSNIGIAVNGVFGSLTSVGTSSFFSSTDILSIGTSGQTGYYQDFKFTKKSVYNLTNFTPPTQILRSISGTVKDDTNSNAIRTIAAVPRSSGSKAFWTTSAADGTYSLTVPDVEHSVIVLDDDAGTLYNDLIMRVLPG